MIGLCLAASLCFAGYVLHLYGAPLPLLIAFGIGAMIAGGRARWWAEAEDRKAGDHD